MAAHRFWRLVGFSVRGAGSLELSEARLYAAGSAVDASVAVICPIAPLSGHLSYLTDGLTTQVVSWSLSAYSNPGFSLTWDLTGSGSSVDAIRFGSGDSSETYPLDVTLQYSDDSAVWTTRRVTTGAAYPGARTLTVEPTALTDLDFEKVSLLVHCDGANGSTTITDSSSVPSTITAFGNAQISTAQSKFGGASIKFDGSGDRVSVPFSTKLDMGSGDWTLELQYYPISAAASDRIYQTRDGDVVPGMYLSHNTATQLQFYWSSSGGFHGSGIVFSIAQNVWQHIAIVNNGGTVRAYVDGVVQGASYSITGSMYKAGDESAVIGGQTSGRTINGYLDEVRLTKGVARYTSNFTPPTLAFSEDQFLPVDIGSPARLRSAPLSLEHFVGSDMPDGAAISHLREVSFFDAYNGGVGNIVGTVKEKNTPANTPLHRRVLLVDEASRIVIRETWSDPITGAFEFRGVKQGVKYSTISYDHTQAFRAVIADRVTPAIVK